MKINFGNNSLETLLNELVQEKIKEVTRALKDGDITHYSQNESYSSTNIDKKVEK